MTIQANNIGCHSEIGRQRGKQNLNLQCYIVGVGCFAKGTLIHEIMHGKCVAKKMFVSQFFFLSHLY